MSSISEKIIDEDIKVLYMIAQVFPEDVGLTFSRLEEKIGDIKGRKFYGIVESGEDGMLYKACVKEKFPGESGIFGLPEDTIASGKYLCKKIKYSKDNIYMIAEGFTELFDDERADDKYPSVEFYRSTDEVILMVRCIVQT